MVSEIRRILCPNIYELHYGIEIQNTLGPFVQIQKSSFNCGSGSRLFGSVVRSGFEFHEGRGIFQTMHHLLVTNFRTLYS